MVQDSLGRVQVRCSGLRLRVQSEFTSGPFNFCDAQMAHIRQSRLDSGLGFQVKVLDIFKVVLSLLDVKEKRFHNWLAGARDWAVPPLLNLRNAGDLETSLLELPLSSEIGTCKAVKARFWPWLSGKNP